jgi:hypothetical protein
MTPVDHFQNWCDRAFARPRVGHHHSFAGAQHLRASRHQQRVSRQGGQHRHAGGRELLSDLGDRAGRRPHQGHGSRSIGSWEPLPALDVGAIDRLLRPVKHHFTGPTQDNPAQRQADQ